MIGDCNAKYSSWSISDTTALKGTQLDYHIFIQGLEVWSHCDPLSGISGGAGGKDIGKFTKFSLKLV